LNKTGLDEKQVRKIAKEEMVRCIRENAIRFAPVISSKVLSQSSKKGEDN
jgi:hypothetical protein